VKRLSNAYLGGERSRSKRRRGAPGKTPFIAAIEAYDERHPLRMKLTAVEGRRLREIASWAQQHLSVGKTAVVRPEFRWVNTILGNGVNAMRGIYHAVRPKHTQRYLAEFEYRFNRRFDLPDIIPKLAYVALRMPPMREELLKFRLA